MGLRERKKAATLEAILAAANELFNGKGYSETTMEEIAEKAVIAVGTVYNYFGSKRDLLLKLMEHETLHFIKAGQKIVDKATDNPEKSLTDLFWTYTEGMMRFDTDLLRELFATFFSEPEEVGKELMRLDYQLMLQVSSLISRFQENGIICDTVPVQQASMILYSVFGLPLLLYIQGELEPKTMKPMIRSNIELIFRSWRKQ